MCQCYFLIQFAVASHPTHRHLQGLQLHGPAKRCLDSEQQESFPSPPDAIGAIQVSSYSFY